MTTNFRDINVKIYRIKNITYNITTKNYRVDKEKLEIWLRVTFFCPPESTNFAFVKRFSKNPLSTKIGSMYQTIWIIRTSLNEPKGKFLKSTQWQEDAFESWHSLQVDTNFSATRTLHNYKFLDTRRKSLTSQIAGYWKSILDNPYSHNSMNRRVCQPLCDSKNFQDTG